jgi:hypothetical protein
MDEFLIPGMTQAQFEHACEEARAELVLYAMLHPEPRDPLDVWQWAFWTGMRTAHFDRLSHG